MKFKFTGKKSAKNTKEKRENGGKTSKSNEKSKSAEEEELAQGAGLHTHTHTHADVRLVNRDAADETKKN